MNLKRNWGQNKPHLQEDSRHRVCLEDKGHGFFVLPARYIRFLE